VNEEINKINVGVENSPHSTPDVLNTPPNGVAGKENKKEKIIVLEIGRPVTDDVKMQIGEPTEIISYPRPILEDEIPIIAGQVYKAIKKHATGGNIIKLVLSGPLGLAFSIGQLIGLSHFKIIVYQFTAGRYKPVPPVSREVMF
jgi:hypothetical protein